jgi:hypothetical protein
MKSYEAARSLFGFLAFISWSVVAVGVIMALVGAASVSQYAGGGAGMLAMVPGIGIGLAGLLLVAFVQMGRANVDTAEYTQQILKISRDQLEVSKQALNQGNQTGGSFADNFEKPKQSLRRSMYAGDAPETKFADQPIASTEREISHQGHIIHQIEERFHIGGKDFERVEHAKNYVDNILVPQDEKLLTTKPNQ